MLKMEQEIKLTEKDRKILGELFEDGRESFSAVGKKVGLSKELVNYRVNRLKEIGLLVGFNTVIDVKKLGWRMFFVYIRFKNINIAQQKTILGFLTAHRNVAQVFETMGNYDTVIKVFAKSIEDAQGIMKGIEERFKQQVDEYFLDFIVEEAAVPFSFLYQSEPKTLYLIERGETGKSGLSGLELKMLKELAKDARMNLAEMSGRLKIDRDMLKYHLKKLEKERIILKYRPDILPKVLGYNWYFLILKTSKLSRKTEEILERFLLNHPNVTYFYKTVGGSDIQVELRVKENEKLNEVVMQLRGILKSVLKRAELLTIMNEQKYTYFPECLAGK